MFTDRINTYQLLRNTAPTFLQIVFTDSTLWPNRQDFTHVSLAHVLASTLYELGRFVLLDSVYSMAYALPQVIEYDTSIPPFQTEIQPVEWVHGCPIELQFALVEINARCNAQNRVGPEPDWQPIERRIKSWQPMARTLPGNESWKAVALLAVQEGWRHTLLIYLYMVS
jgi:hypothetical protein